MKKVFMALMLCIFGFDCLQAYSNDIEKSLYINGSITFLGKENHIGGGFEIGGRFNRFDLTYMFNIEMTSGNNEGDFLLMTFDALIGGYVVNGDKYKLAMGGIVGVGYDTKYHNGWHCEYGIHRDNDPYCGVKISDYNTYWLFDYGAYVRNVFIISYICGINVNAGYTRCNGVFISAGIVLNM